MEFFYENQWGTIHFKGGSRAHGAGIYVKAVTGLGMPGKEYQIASYVNRPGQEVISARDLERVITLSVDVCSRHNVQEEVRCMTSVLYHPGTLTILSGTVHRKIACRCSGMEPPEYQGKHIVSVILQLTCDNPYFTDDMPHKVTLFARRDLVSGTFTLPCVFTERTTRKTVTNQGDVSVEPVVTIYNTGSAAVESELTDDYGIYVVNHTTNKTLTLLYHTVPGEFITLDIPSRRVTSNLNGNLIASLAQDSFLSDFCLETGTSDIEVIRHNPSEEINVLLTYDQQYIEAVV